MMCHNTTEAFLSGGRRLLDESGSWRTSSMSQIFQDNVCVGSISQGSYRFITSLGSWFCSREDWRTLGLLLNS